MITFSNVSKVFPDGTSAVHELDLTVDPGTITMFLGPSGCGKTTSMRMINRMVEPTSGRVIVDGTDNAVVDRTTLRLGIGYVMQHAGLLPHRSVLDNVASVLRLKGVGKRDARATAHETLERVGLEGPLFRKYPAQLSGGQQQRVGVARALASDPPLMLMDEPFSSVDPLVREDLQQELLRLQEDLRKTIVFVTHDIEEALVLGGSIAVFGPGGVLQQHASPEQVLAAPANDFVSRFVGRDRGIRYLSFVEAAGLPVVPAPAPRDGAVPLEGGWAIALDEAGRPRLWRAHDGVETPVTATLPEGGSLKAAVDAVLSSPARMAPVVDGTGSLRGAVTGRDVFAAVENPPGN